MKIAFLSEAPHLGKVPKTYPNMRTELAWQYALNSDHFNIHKYDLVKDYDAVLVVFPKALVKTTVLGKEIMYRQGIVDDVQNIKIYSSPIIKTLKENNKLVCNVQEGPCWLLNEYDIETQFQFINQLSECDILFAHNNFDTKFYKGMFPSSRVEVIPTHMIEDPRIHQYSDGPKEDKTVIGGNWCRWYGGLQSYMVALEFGNKIFCPSMHARRQGEENVPNLTHVNYLIWIIWMIHLKTYKYAVHLMPTAAAGTFSMNCLSQDTDVVTMNGIKNIRDVKIGDYVISKNMSNGDSEWKRVINLVKSPNQKTFHITGRSIDFISTGNHNLIIKKRDGRRKHNIGYKKEYYFETVEKIYKQKHQLKARRKLPEFSPIINYMNINSKYPYLTKDGAELLGWFISEGNTRDWNIYPSDNRIDIAQRKAVNLENYNKILQLLKNMGYDYRSYDDRISFSDKILKKYIIDNVGRLCHTKRIPEECFTWTYEMRSALWESMMRGDGNKKYTTYTTTSQQLQKDFALLTMTIGKGITLSKPIIQKSIKHHTLYQVFIHKTNGNILYAKNITEHTSQETYCIEVEDNHNFVAGRNGKFQFIGNCAFHGIPCIGNKLVDTQLNCFPELSVDVDDIQTARQLAHQLKNDGDFYNKISKYAYDYVRNSTYCNTEKWVEYMMKILQSK